MFPFDITELIEIFDHDVKETILNFNNFNKRIIKSPKIYFYDMGVASSLLRISNPEILKTHYLYGALFENLVISEIVKCHAHKGKRPSVFYWRESNGTEIDCIVDRGNKLHRPKYKYHKRYSNYFMGQIWNCHSGIYLIPCKALNDPFAKINNPDKSGFVQASRREGDSNPRFAGRRTTVFETAAFDRSAISPFALNQD